MIDFKLNMYIKIVPSSESLSGLSGFTVALDIAVDRELVD